MIILRGESANIHRLTWSSCQYLASAILPNWRPDVHTFCRQPIGWLSTRKSGIQRCDFHALWHAPFLLNLGLSCVATMLSGHHVAGWSCSTAASQARQTTPQEVIVPCVRIDGHLGLVPFTERMARQSGMRLCGGGNAHCHAASIAANSSLIAQYSKLAL